jgi:hypothetical protein
MALLGQASGGFTESSSALRLLHVGIRNTVGVLTEDSFTQTNPPVTTVAAQISTQVDTSVLGVLSGSVAFARVDAGSNFVGGPAEPGGTQAFQIKPLGCFINTAVGNAFENQPGPASGKGPYVSGQGTFGNALFETQVIQAITVGGATLAAGTDIVYSTGMRLISSRNGYLQPAESAQAGAATSFLNAAHSVEITNGVAAADVTIIGILKMPPDATMNELVYDQRI